MAERQDGEKPASAEGDKPADMKTDASVAGKVDATKDAQKDVKQDAMSDGKTKPASAAAKDDGKPASSAATRAGEKASEKPDATKKSGGGARILFWLVLLIVVIGGGAYATKGLWLPKAGPHFANVPLLKKLFPGTDGTMPAGAPVVATPPTDMERLAARVAALEKKTSTGGESDMTALRAEKARMQSNLQAALQRIDELEKRIADVRTMATSIASGAVPSSSSTSTPVMPDLAPLISRLDELESRGKETRSEVETLTAKLTEAKQASAGADAKARSLVLAVAQLRSAALAGTPYRDLLTSLDALAGDNPELKAVSRGLVAGAAKGLPSQERLRVGFESIAGKIVALAKSGGDGWLDQAIGKVKTLATLRRTDGASSDTVENAVAAIEKNLASGDLATAYDLAGALRDAMPKDAQALISGWMAEARVRLDALRSLDALQSHAVAQLGSGG